ncbi:hypothetical protein [Serratia fonticola]|uniref:hypothetical protein n=1 Tax=Serratia fonticola TaxID=47917 RepID=UPI003B007DAC
MSDTTNQDIALSTNRLIFAFSTSGRVITPLEFKVAGDAQLFIDLKVILPPNGVLAIAALHRDVA